MRKIFLFCLMCAVAAVTASAANIKMVTYFPVPYASYQNLDVEKTLDVGVMSCAMNLSCPNNQYALNVYQDANPGSSVLKQGYLRVTSGALNLNSSGKAVSNVMKVGNQSGTGGALDFKRDLRIASLTNRGQSLEAANEDNTVSALKIFPDHISNNFPACTNDGGFTGAPDVAWKSLELGSKEGKAVSNVFLVCGNSKGGEAEEPKDCTDSTYFNQNKASCCAQPSIKTANKSACCPLMPQTDSVCWTQQYYWEWMANDITPGGRYFNVDCSVNNGGDAGLPTVASILGHGWACKLASQLDVASAGGGSSSGATRELLPFSSNYPSVFFVPGSGTCVPGCLPECDQNSLGKKAIHLTGHVDVHGGFTIKLVFFDSTSSIHACTSTVTRNGW